jgi:DNA-binding IclR family transcriptional regulator
MISVFEIMTSNAKSTSASSRQQTHQTGVFVRTTPGSQSLERGLSILRTFRQGVGLLTNADIAERTGLVRPTVSRLCRSLVESGFLEYDIQRRGYRLSIASLSLALSFRSSEPELESALALMRELAQGRQVNVGIATADHDEMVYLESVRFSRKGIFRRIVAGSRIPIPVTSLGCAYLAGLDPVQRQLWMERWSLEQAKDWPQLDKRIQKALRQYRVQGYCYAQWQAGMGAAAAPIHSPSGRTYAINISFPVGSGDSENVLLHLYAPLLLELVAQIQHHWSLPKAP